MPALGLGVETYTGTDAASVSGFSSRTSLTSWEAVKFLAIDSQQVSGLRGQDMYFAKLHLTPGQHDFSVEYLSPRGFLRGFWTADVILRATLRASGEYHLAATRDGNRVRLWIEDSVTHEHVSTIIGSSEPIVKKLDVQAPAQ
jgi:hypothetical protein